MAERMVTIIRCGKCNRSGDVTVHDDRFWCARCQDWSVMETVQVRDATVRMSGTEPTLVRAEEAGYPLQPLRIPAGWHVAYNNGLYEIDPDLELVPEADRWWVFKDE